MTLIPVRRAESQGLGVSGSQSLRVSRSKSLRISEAQDLRISGSQSLGVSGSQSLGVSESQGLSILEFQGLRLSGSQDLRVSGSQAEGGYKPTHGVRTNRSELAAGKLRRSSAKFYVCLTDLEENSIQAAEQWEEPVERHPPVRDPGAPPLFPPQSILIGPVEQARRGSGLSWELFKTAEQVSDLRTFPMMPLRARRRGDQDREFDPRGRPRHDPDTHTHTSSTLHNDLYVIRSTDLTSQPILL